MEPAQHRAEGVALFNLVWEMLDAPARTPELDKSIVEAMTKGKQAVVKGTPQKGPTTADTYSLASFAQALALIDKACGVKREDRAGASPHPPRKRSVGRR